MNFDVIFVISQLPPYPTRNVCARHDLGHVFVLAYTFVGTICLSVFEYDVIKLMSARDHLSGTVPGLKKLLRPDLAVLALSNGNCTSKGEEWRDRDRSQ